jgi:2,4-dienoyl-CoA reductase-like NADH-dependent reductase (Old Yellow Enzyme family)
LEFYEQQKPLKDLVSLKVSANHLNLEKDEIISLINKFKKVNKNSLKDNYDEVKIQQIHKHITSSLSSI